MRTDRFDYHLPEDLIARYPSQQRGDSRMLVLDRGHHRCDVKKFSDITSYLSPGDCMVFNNTQVTKARMYGSKVGEDGSDGAKIEILLLNPMNEAGDTWRCLLRPRKRVRPGTVIFLLTPDGRRSTDSFTVLSLLPEGSCSIEFNTPHVQQLGEAYGTMPIPPYFNRPTEAIDYDRYQTVYAKKPGAVAAPTAGLHFTDSTMQELDEKGVKRTELTLHVGPGTFKPVSVDDIANHEMHTEEFFLPTETADLINETHAAGKRVLAVGTTTVRVLESCVDEFGHVCPQDGATNIFIHPPYQPRAVDMLLTNFHLPKSTLLMLVSAFASRDAVLEAYELAKKEKFRFYSYGDCMLLV